MKLVGVDYGTKRVGIAVSDETGSVAFPKAVYPNDRHLVPDLVVLIKKEGAAAVVVGESKDMHGKDNPVMEGARRFAGDLARESGVPVHFEPEFYTSFEARRTKHGDGTTVDAEAAAIILNSYILKHEREKQ